VGRWSCKLFAAPYSISPKLLKKKCSDRPSLLNPPSPPLPAIQSRLPKNPSSPSIISPSNATAPSGAARPGGPAHTDSRGTGLDRILNTINIDESTKSDAIESSMKDLESLMAKAGEMVRFFRIPSTSRFS
jgi:hypothetical protein